jgi:hypothetical protein
MTRPCGTLSLAMIRNLAEVLKIPVQSLISAYSTHPARCVAETPVTYRVAKRKKTQ